MNNIDVDKQPYVKMTIDAGVPPIELKLTQVNDPKTKEVIAYRSTAEINSVMLGVLKEKDYEAALLKSPVGYDLFEWGINEVIQLIKTMEENGKDFEWISYKCSPNFTSNTDLYTIVKRAIEENDLQHPEKLCIEFDNSILTKHLDQASQTILDFGLLNVKTLITGCGSEECPIHMLSNVPITMAIMDPKITAQAIDKDKKSVIESLTKYLESMKIKSILCEVLDDKQIEAFESIDVYGYIPSEFYVGLGTHSIRPLRVADVI